MGRGRRFVKKRNNDLKKLTFLSIILLGIIILTFIITFILYNNKLKNSMAKSKSLQTQEIAQLVSEINLETDKIETTSTEIGKKIEDVINETEDELETEYESSNNENKSETIEVVEEVVEEQIIEPEFINPVEGEIINEYAKDMLIYSNTLDEWITHLGIDIKAERASIVQSSEEGNIFAIKNDPRYRTYNYYRTYKWVQNSLCKSFKF